MKGTTKAKTWQETMEEFDRAERAQEERDRSNGLIYSLDDETVRDYLENQCVDCHQNPCRVLIKKEAFHTLSDALDSLTTTQRRRITQFVLAQKSYSEIARLEGVDESAVRRSIERGLLQLRKMLIGTSISGNDFSEHSQTRYVKHFHPKKETTDRQNGKASLININEGGVQDGE